MSNNTTNPSHELCETTAAMAQAEAMSPVIASEIGQHAVEERNAARDAAQHAREMGRKLTGDFEGDADRDKVKHSLASTSIKLDQNYGPDTSKNGPQDPGNRVMSSAQGTASTVDKKSGEALHHAEDTISQSLSKGTPTTNTGNNTEQGKGYLQTMTDHDEQACGDAALGCGDCPRYSMGSHVYSLFQKEVTRQSPGFSPPGRESPGSNKLVRGNVQAFKKSADPSNHLTTTTTARYKTMDFLNLAKQGIQAYSDSQSNVNKTGGQELNTPDNTSSSGGYSPPSINHEAAIETAGKHGQGESSLFSTALSFLSDNKSSQSEPLDEESVTKAHEKVYKDGNTSGMSASLLGSAAALQVLKQFVSGSGTSGSSASASGGSTQLVSLAMAEATKLFDKSGGAASGQKQDAVNGAAMTIMKLLVQSKFGGAPTTGGSDSGGLGGLLSLASKLGK